MKQKIEVEFEIPDGYEFVRWACAIIRKVPAYRPCDARDVGKACDCSDDGEGWRGAYMYIGPLTDGRIAAEDAEDGSVDSWMHARVAMESGDTLSPRGGST